MLTEEEVDKFFALNEADIKSCMDRDGEISPGLIVGIDSQKRTHLIPLNFADREQKAKLLRNVTVGFALMDVHEYFYLMEAWTITTKVKPEPGDLPENFEDAPERGEQVVSAYVNKDLIRERHYLISRDENGKASVDMKPIFDQRVDRTVDKESRGTFSELLPDKYIPMSTKNVMAVPLSGRTQDAH